MLQQVHAVHLRREQVGHDLLDTGVLQAALAAELGDRIRLGSPVEAIPVEPERVVGA